MIPKSLREKAKVKKGGYVRISIIIEPVESVADRYFGAFKVMEWPKDLDEFLIEEARKCWSQKAT